MENKLTNEEIARVFAMYFNSECEEYVSKQVTGRCPSYYAICKFCESDREQDMSVFKLLLTPLSSISDEHAIEVAKINFPLYQTLPATKDKMIRDGKDSAHMCHSAKVFQYLIQQGYAVPLFFGIGNWATGKTAIELGIAIPDPHAGNGAV